MKYRAKTNCISAAALLLIVARITVFGQEPSASSRAESFESHGEVTVGYRLTDVQGYRPQYEQMFNLRDGFRLYDFNLHGDAVERTNRFADN